MHRVKLLQTLHLIKRPQTFPECHLPARRFYGGPFLCGSSSTSIASLAVASNLGVYSFQKGGIDLIKLERQFLKDMCFLAKNDSDVIYIDLEAKTAELFDSPNAESISIEKYVPILNSLASDLARESNGYLKGLHFSEYDCSFSLTFKAFHYNSIVWDKVKGFLLKSIVTPIVVSILTTLLTILLTSLSQPTPQ